MTSKKPSGDTTTQILSALDDLRSKVEALSDLRSDMGALTETVNGQGKQWSKGLNTIVDRLNKITTGEQTGGTGKAVPKKKKETDPNKPKHPLTVSLKFRNDHLHLTKGKFDDIDDKEKKKEKIKDFLDKLWNKDKKVQEKYNREHEEALKKYQKEMKEYLAKKEKEKQNEIEGEDESGGSPERTQKSKASTSSKKGGSKRGKSPQKSENIFDDSDDELTNELEKED